MKMLGIASQLGFLHLTTMTVPSNSGDIMKFHCSQSNKKKSYLRLANYRIMKWKDMIGLTSGQCASITQCL